ncbi:hypothetical protein K466DRAFT_569013 [Polyporus arcularius HHB13444]|uniref:SAM-dependent MTase RsmB/NOP-type domain-containing protein n=1 Tax=Polyporus arcularius HHB13444 TaxID=1314778 RepID=A0A5C3NY39_9APHY|nr:hypothetical protein K466DRAFT_569013 [Polyporus arcularius HHB13444]
MPLAAWKSPAVDLCSCSFVLAPLYILLNLQVLDMCAAPGFKTAQLLEALHAHDTMTSSSIPSDLLIANDSDYKRTHLLIHQSSRLPARAYGDESPRIDINIPSEQTIFRSSTKARVAAKKQYQLRPTPVDETEAADIPETA